jgi:hypothetical protein
MWIISKRYYLVKEKSNDTLTFIVYFNNYLKGCTPLIPVTHESEVGSQRSEYNLDKSGSPISKTD